MLFRSDWLYQLYNTIFTTAPIVYFAVLDKEYERDEFLNNTELYQSSRKWEYFNNWVFWRWMRDGAWQGFVILVVPIFVFANNASSTKGLLEDLGFIGGIVFTLVVVIVNLKILIAYNTHTIGSLFLTLGSIGIYYPCYYGIAKSNSQSIYGSFGRLFTNLTAVLVQILIISSLLLWEIILQQTKRILSEVFKVFETSILPKKKEYIPQITTLNTGFAFSQDPGQTPQILTSEFNYEEEYF